ncbi:TIGR04563 family protein [Myxococcus sp. K15C18031901]|uniref:TIGR04563 family protein n=1 Tax=Myxococcus dinghuensis TaxID=2906761 RepID=UPI0020A75B07|nr:TIGR04563 family protein [Myxococcus dinghuensis]MCP3103505.1 TIGR04563 family protein [Myxococcus dinghuensis]
MATTDHRKQSLYFPEDMLQEIQREANRQDRSLSWIVQQAWKVARADIRKMPSVNDVLSAPPRPAASATGSAVAATTATPLVAAAPNSDEPKS